MGPSSSRGRSKEIVQRLEITGLPDAHSVEALRLEIQQLARGYGLGPEDVQVEVVDQPVVRPRRPRPRRLQAPAKKHALRLKVRET